VTTPCRLASRRNVQPSPLRLQHYRRFYFGSIGAALGYQMQATVAAG
jgi:hypothetical protein